MIKTIQLWRENDKNSFGRNDMRNLKQRVLKWFGCSEVNRIVYTRGIKNWCSSVHSKVNPSKTKALLSLYNYPHEDVSAALNPVKRKNEKQKKQNHSVLQIFF